MNVLRNATFAIAVAAGCSAASPTSAEQTASHGTTPDKPVVPVTVKTFPRAESDLYFSNTVKLGAFGKFYHFRAMAPIEKQNVVRQNRDTLYSAAVFDLDAGPVTVTLPENGKRFMTMQIVNEDHFAPFVAYAPGSFVLDKVKMGGTRYVMAAVRTLANPDDPADMKAANALQDAIKVAQARAGQFEIPHWDPVSQGKIRDDLKSMQSMSGGTNERRMGTGPNDVDPIYHLMATATGWGLNPPEAAIYDPQYPTRNDGKTVFKLTVKDVPVDGFWPISVYNAKGYFEKNALNAYSLNNLTAKPNADGAYTIQFGGCTETTPNCLYTPAGWNYSVRMYRPRKEVIDGSWKFPHAQPAQ